MKIAAPKSLARPRLLALCCAMACAMPAHADERESVEAVRQTTLNLIEALVESGVLPRAKADALIRAAHDKAAAQVAARPDAAATRTAGQDGRPTTTADGKPVFRVPYVPQSVRDQIRDEVKGEVIAQARAERWGVPDAPSWGSRIKVESDLRLRYQHDSPSGNNTSAAAYALADVTNSNGLSRMPDFASYAVNDAGDLLPTANTTEAVNRERIRLRVGLTADVTDEVEVGVRLATGSAMDRVSTNQTLGQNFNKYQFFVDRAYIRLKPNNWLSIQGGRIPNPWFSTEMVWNENLNFEGISATFRSTDTTDRLSPFLTLGYFPLREDSPPSRNSRSFWGAQIGTDLEVSTDTRVRFGLAYYHYNNIEGYSDADYTVIPPPAEGISVGSTYGRYEYPVGLRQRGNTVFETNPLLNFANNVIRPTWGLAYEFRPVVLTASVVFTQFQPFEIMLTAEYANNTAFSASDFHRRADPTFYAGVNPGGRRDGYNLKMTVGALKLVNAGDWQTNFNYRHVGSDAVLDAFTDSDLGLGGTNLRGFSVGFLYNLYRNTSVGLRYLSAQNIDSTINSNYPTASYKVDSLQGDINVRF